MTRLIVRRVLVAPLVLIAVLTLVFVLVEAAPGSPADTLLGERPAPPELRARLEAVWGLDRPPAERYVRWLRSAATGDLGWSLSRGRPVAEVLGHALPATIALSGLALLVHLGAGLALGAAAALGRGRWPDRVASSLGLALYASPPFWLGIVAILVFAYAWPLLPPAGSRTIGSEAWGAGARLVDFVRHAVLPALVLGLGSAASLARHVRSGLLEAASEGFVRAARARGAGTRSALIGHALRAALVPAIQLTGIALPALVSGSLAVEVVFGWPGMGRLAWDAATAEDVPVVLATTLVASALVVVGSLLSDVGAAIADPRIRLGARGEAG